MEKVSRYAGIGGVILVAGILTLTSGFRLSDSVTNGQASPKSSASALMSDVWDFGVYKEEKIVDNKLIEKTSSRVGTGWMSLKEVEEKLKQQPRPVLVDLYTDWCGWCKTMDKKTYAHPEVSAYLNDRFYTIKFNAESRQPVQWQGKTYRYNERYRTHELALYLSRGDLSYPTTVFIPVQPDAGPQPVPGYLPPPDMQLIATYFGEGHFGRTPFEKYQKSFRPTWK